MGQVLELMVGVESVQQWGLHEMVKAQHRRKMGLGSSGAMGPSGK